MKCTFRFVALFLGLAIALSASAEIYQWKDKDGKMHFSDRPPPNQPSIQTQKPKQAQQPVTAPAQDEDDAEEGGDKPKKAVATTPAPAQEKSKAEQSDEEARKRRAAAEAREKAEKDADRAAQNCERARTQYAALNSGQRISRLTETGERRFLNDEERAAETERTRELMEAFCGKN
ncbi:MAG: DUF4124 domain-containing protein [Betaproteobacteria bacterium]|nr:DUF4124 domain-containing protein [Betaproteobacteria bacterium]